jgi:hypothetical protein
MWKLPHLLWCGECVGYEKLHQFEKQAGEKVMT